MAPVLAEIGQYRALSGVEQVLAAAIVARLCVVAPARARYAVPAADRVEPRRARARRPGSCGGTGSWRVPP